MPVSRAASRVAPAIAVTTPTGRFCGFQHRTLLDVKFEIGQQFAARPCRRADMSGVETKLDQRLAHRNPGGVRGAEHALVKRARDRAAAEQRGCEADAFLVGEPDHLDGERQPALSLVQIGNAGNRGDQAERAVPFAGIADGVVMRAQHQARQARGLAFVTAADISDRIEMRVHAGGPHPVQDEVGRRAMLGGEENAGQMFRGLGNLRQPLDPADDFITQG